MEYSKILIFSLVFCDLIINEVQGKPYWIVNEKVSGYGDKLTLFCLVDDCCVKAARWTKFVPSFTTIYLDVRDSKNNTSKKDKYTATTNSTGFSLVIQMLQKEDLNIKYSCSYGFEHSPTKRLLQSDVFKVDETTNTNFEDEITTVTVLTSLGGSEESYKYAELLVAGIILGAMLCAGIILLATVNTVKCKQPTIRRRTINKECENYLMEDAEKGIQHYKVEEDYKDAEQALERYKENIPREIIEWAKQDKHFHITPAAKHISELMKTNNIVTVIGATMEGKSASIRHIAIQLMDSFEYQIVPCRGPLDIRMLYEQNTNQVFVIDDIYGKCALDMTKLNAWIEYELKLSSILSYSKGRTKILASSQSHIYNKAKFKLLNQDTDSEALCDLTSDNAALSEEAIQDISSKISYLKKLIRT